MPTPSARPATVTTSHLLLAEERLAGYRRDPSRVRPARDVRDRLTKPYRWTELGWLPSRESISTSRRRTSGRRPSSHASGLTSWASCAPRTIELPLNLSSIKPGESPDSTSNVDSRRLDAQAWGVPMPRGGQLSRPWRLIQFIDRPQAMARGTTSRSFHEIEPAL
jgi:hypothetical protein